MAPVYWSCNRAAMEYHAKERGIGLSASMHIKSGHCILSVISLTPIPLLHSGLRTKG